ncbi:hypothetical protein [Dechloromonas sp. CZR5]|uniref:hypothetical protein n=1 Tax=Dechloromonas sp. CZR5 TaxID=2608630 RepID=UPI00123E0D24|nr:hypothetical protein [Dechloromonas sp. CZR5]
MKFLRYLLFLALTPAVLIGGCTGLVVGEGMFYVTGELSVPTKNCEIYLLSESGGRLPHAQRAIERQAFSEDFVVSPKPENYEVIVSCEGVIRKTAVVRYGTQVNPGKEVSLGKIAL